jgi:hypothetical protein
MLKFCFEVEARSELQYPLVHFVSPPPGILIPQHIYKVLAPFLPALQDYLVAQVNFGGQPLRKVQREHRQGVRLHGDAPSAARFDGRPNDWLRGFKMQRLPENPP